MSFQSIMTSSVSWVSKVDSVIMTSPVSWASKGSPLSWRHLYQCMSCSVNGTPLSWHHLCHKLPRFTLLSWRCMICVIWSPKVTPVSWCHHCYCYLTIYYAWHHFVKLLHYVKNQLSIMHDLVSCYNFQGYPIMHDIIKCYFQLQGYPIIMHDIIFF